VTLWWEPPANDGCASISHYVIEKRETSRIAWALVDDKCEACSYTALKLIKGNEYQFRVSAVNKFGVGRPLESDPVVAQIPYSKFPPHSVEITVELLSSISNYVSPFLFFSFSFLFLFLFFFSFFFFLLALPDAPGTPEPTNVTGDSITLTWARPKSDGGSEINEYILERREKKSMRWVKVSSKRPIAENRYRVTGLIEGNEYEFHVMAENAAGVGPPSDVSKLIKCREPVSPPSAPNVVRVTDTSKTSVSLEWTKPVFDGGMEIIGYIIEMCKADLETWQKVNAETVLATKYTVVDLEAGEHYKFRVSAVNGAGKGESCEVPASVQTVDRLSAPEIDIDANFKQTHIVRAGATIRLFIAFSGRPVPTAVWSKADANLSLRADIQTTDSFSTLTVEECNRNDAGKYVFTVENNSGSKSITFTVKVLDTPGPPGPITFKDVTRGSITLMWDAPVLDGGSRIHHYVVEKREASRRSWQVVSSKCTRQIFKVTDLAEGVPYYYRVSAENEYGVGEPCELTEPVVATEEPAPPKRLDIVDTTKSSVVLAWLKPDHDGGSRVTGYLLEMKQKGSDKWIPAGHTKQLTFTVEGLVENTEYEFRVKAKNDAGYSEPREAFSSVIIKEPQIEPTADLSEISRQLITCKAGSAFTIDIPISGRPAPKVTWKLEEMRLKETERVTIKTTKDRTTLTVKDSMRGDSGKYYLTLENTAGVKTFTVTVVVIGRPGPVTGPIEISSVSAESCMLTWKEPEDDGGSDITNYIVEKRESGTTAWQLVNSSVKRTQIKVTRLTKYQEYSFRVSSENRFGVSKPLESKTVVAEHPFGK